MKLGTRSLRGKATIGSAVLLAIGAIAVGASVTSSAMAADDTAAPTAAADAVVVGVVGVASVGTDGVVDGYQCTFTDLPLAPTSKPVEVGAVGVGAGETAPIPAEGVLEVSGEIGVGMSNSVSVKSGSSSADGVAGYVTASTGDEATAQVIASLDAPMAVPGDGVAVAGADKAAIAPDTVRDGTADECAAMRAEIAP